MSRARLDLEKDKFDSQGRVKVALNNTSSDPLPVEIINADSAIDVEVSIPDQISIDDSTPIDVNVTNTSVNTNATIQNASIDVNLTDLDINSRLPVSVDNQPTVTVDDSTPIDTNITNASINTNATIQGTPSVSVSGDVGIDDATAIRVDVTNASIATNATIQNAELDVNVTNPFQYVYDMVYDGSQWRFQLSDTNGKAINLDHTYYTSTEITALGSSTDINLWLAAYNDSMLQYKYVGSYDDQYEVEVYLTHPDLGDGNKCLKLIFDYSTQNSVKVVQSVYASIVDWSFDASVTGALTVTLGTVTSPDPNSAIAVGTDICTIAVSNTGQGTVTISLSGTNASLYTLRNVTDAVTGSSLAYDPLKSYVLETASDFSGASYSHSVTITATNDLYGNTDSENVATSGEYTATSGFSNTKYFYGAGNASLDGVYSESTNGGFFGSGSGSSATTELRTATRSIAFWFKPTYSSVNNQVFLIGDFSGTTRFTGIAYNPYSKLFWTNINDYASGNNYQTNYGITLSNGLMNTWCHACFNYNSTSTVNDVTIYINGVAQTMTYNFTSTNYNTTGHTDHVISKSMVMGPKVYNNALYPTSLASESLGIDEIICFSPKLDETNNEVTELYTSSSSGTTGQVFDYTTHSRASDVYKYIRWGDGSSDTESSIYCQTTSSTFQLDKTSGLTSTYINTLTSSDSIYVPASGTWNNSYYARSNTTTSSVVDFRLNGSEKSLWPSLSTGTNTFPPVSTAWGMSFWIYMSGPDTDLSNTYRECLIKQQVGTAQGGIQVFMRGTNTLECYVSATTAGNYFYGAISSGFTYGTWNLVTINYDGNYALDVRANNTSTAGSTGTTGSTSTLSTQLSNATINNLEIMSFVYTPAGGSSVLRANKFYRMDELVAYDRELTQSERDEIYNSGTPSNPSSYSFASTITSYFRFGDGSNDDTSNFYAYDDNDSTRYFEPVTAGTRDFTTY